MMSLKYACHDSSKHPAGKQDALQLRMGCMV